MPTETCEIPSYSAAAAAPDFRPLAPLCSSYEEGRLCPFLIPFLGGSAGESLRRGKTQARNPTDKKEVGRGPARKGDLGAAAGNPRRLRRQGHWGGCPSGSPTYVSVGSRRIRSRAVWRHRDTSRRLSRWRCFRAHWAYWPRACAGPWQHPRRSGTS